MKVFRFRNGFQEGRQVQKKWSVVSTAGGVGFGSNEIMKREGRGEWIRDEQPWFR